MPKIIGFSGEEKDFEPGELLRDKCEEMGVPFGCKDGECGCCRIVILEGENNLSKKNEKEKKVLGNDDPKERLACQTKIMKSTVKIQYY